ncbi:hypothetical protein [Micromonospora auratinigra]|uniref:4-amino-4-deoxy-L-arabinose transferase n=1 Tax=Micromonospora auratinigra TaxID=261654 RepID=A0A1A8Z135_9ACTN|nr:hypothetical protein [Micromonospora auratinigra]SBT37533.1 hypothetical protein GA0070611_0239 [Micromonospora auratinigra]
MPTPTRVPVAARPPVDPTPPGSRRPARRLPAAALWLAAAWLVPLLAYAVGVSAVLPPLLLALTAGLLRAGRTLLDRLVLATALLLGATCAAGLLFSVWPWGLHPVPVAGTAGTVLLGVALVTGRRPRWPRPGVTDLPPVLAAVLGALALGWPYLRAGDLAGRLAYAMVGEDNSRHLATVEGIRAVGGYLFTDPQGAARIAPESMTWYPQGFHLVAALLDTFLRASTTPADPLDALDHYLGWALAAYALLVLALVWAATRLAGRQLDVTRTWAVAGVVTALCLGSELARFVAYGYPGETLGLALVTLLVAVLCRPVAGTGTQLCLIGALCVGVGFAYLMFLPVVGVLVAAWLVAQRRKVLRRPWVLAGVALLVVPLAPLTSVGGLLRTRQLDNVASGGVIDPRYDAFLALTALVGVGLLAGGLRLPVWRRYAATMGIALLFVLGVRVWFRVLGAPPAYYYGKTLHLLLAVLVVGIGALALLLPPPWTRSGRRPGPAARALVAAAVVVAATGVAGLPRGAGIFAQPLGARTSTWASAWWSGRLARPGAADLTARALVQSRPEPGTAVVVASGQRRLGYLCSLFVATLQGTAGASGRAYYYLPLAEPARSPAVVAAFPGRIVFLAADDRAEASVRQLLADHPDLRSRVRLERLR